MAIGSSVYVGVRCLAVCSSVVGSVEGWGTALLVKVRGGRHGTGQSRSLGPGGRLGSDLAVGMIATEDRAVWLGSCRRPLGGWRVRHSVDLVEVGKWIECVGGSLLTGRGHYKGGVYEGGVCGNDISFRLCDGGGTVREEG